MDGEAVDYDTVAINIRQHADHPLAMVAVEDAGMALEVAEREVVVKRFVAFETTIQLAIAHQPEGVFVNGITLVGAFLDPDDTIVEMRFEQGSLQIVG